MALVSYNGRFFVGELAPVRDVLAQWLDVPDLETREGSFGPEIYYKRDGAKVYCEPVPDSGEPRFLLSGELSGTASECERKLRSLVDLARAGGIDTSLQYEVIDEDGNPLSGEVDLI